MKRTPLTLIAIALLAASTAFAQGRGQGNGSGSQNGPGTGAGTGTGTGTPQVDVLHPITVQGQVLAFAASPASGTPSLSIREGSKDYTFVLGPYRYLSAQSFAAQTGDTVKVTYFACTSCESGMAVSQVVNLTKNLTLNLRSADGLPLWKGRGGHGGHGSCGQGAGNGPSAGMGQGQQGTPRCGGAGPDMSRVATVEGTVKSFEGGPGIGQPELVLTTSAGDKEFLLSPFRALAAAGYLPAAGARMKVTAAPVTVDGAEEWVVISFEDLSTGFKLTLRDPATGIPARGRCRA